MALSKDALNMGFSWHQEENGKIWWTLITGTTAAPRQVVAQVAAVTTVPDGAAPADPASDGVPEGGFSAEQFLNQ